MKNLLVFRSCGVSIFGDSQGSFEPCPVQHAAAGPALSTGLD